MNAITEEVQFDQIEYVQQLESQIKDLIEKNEFLEMANLSQEKNLREKLMDVAKLRTQVSSLSNAKEILESDVFSLTYKLNSLRAITSLYQQESFIGKILNAGLYFQLHSQFNQQDEK